VDVSSLGSVTSDLLSDVLVSNSIKENDLDLISDNASKVEAIADEVAWRAALRDERVIDV